MADLLFEYTFVVLLDKIYLEVEKPTESKIKFQCDEIFFARTHQEYLELEKNVCRQSKEIPGQEKHVMSRMKESELKKYLDTYCLSINLFDNNISFGNALVDLRPFNDRVEEMPFELLHPDQIKISDKDGVQIGSIDCLFTLTKEECFACKSCKLYYKVSTILKHFSKPNNNCKSVYTEKELEELNEKSEARGKHLKAQRRRLTYDPVKKSKENKRNYCASKRAMKYKREKEDSKRFKPEEEKARNIDKIEFEKMQTKKNLFLINKAKEYFLKCTEGVNHAAMSERDIKLQNEMKLEIEQIFRYLENEIKIYSRKAQGIKLMIDLKPLHDINIESISMEWKRLFYKIEESFYLMAEHLKEYNGYFGAWSDFGLLQMPVISPCKDVKPCKLCKIASTEEKEKWELKAKEGNDQYFREALRYYYACLSNLYCLDLSQEARTIIQNVRKEIDDDFERVELEIDTISLKAKDTARWIDVYYLFESLNSYPNGKLMYNTPFQPRVKYDKPIIFEEWRKVMVKIASQIYKMSEHVEDYRDIYGAGEFGVLNQPKIEPCNGEKQCKKCLER